MRSKGKRYLITVGLLLPILAFYATHFFNHDGGLSPTGFVTAEHATYMLYAKQYQTGEASFFFRYPFIPEAASAYIFFQPQTLVLGYLWRWTGLPPGVVLTIFGLVFSFFTIRTAYDIIHLLCRKHKTLITALFIWGGGLMVFMGVAYHLLVGPPGSDITAEIFRFDPGGGWWCLYFGRALIYPLEAYYHFLFLLAILLLLKHKYWNAAVVVNVLTVSHSYTSVELSLILLTWLLLERTYFRSEVRAQSGLNFLIGSCVFTFVFYGVLTMMPLYRDLFNKVSLDWGYKAWNFVPAYALVWLLCAYVVRTPGFLKLAVDTPTKRLFLVWGIAAFVLSVHNFAIRPVQPLHFTRGYVYAGFFLFAAVNLSEKMLDLLAKTWIYIAIVILFCFDNLIWFGMHFRKNSVGAYLNREELALIGFFSGQGKKYIIDNSEKDAEIALFIQLYTDHVASIPHEYLTLNTPGKGNSNTKDQQRSITAYHLPIVRLVHASDSSVQGIPRYMNRTYAVYEVK